MRQMYFKVVCKNVKNDEEHVFLYKSLEDAQKGIAEKRKAVPPYYNFRIYPIKLKF